MDILMPTDGLLAAPLHGADLAAASERYGIPISDWLDVSTGINPRAYPLAHLLDNIDAAAFQHLPFNDIELRRAAKNYCNAPALPIIAAGSQVLIQWLPLVYTQLMQRKGRIAIPNIGYSEHGFRWRWAGHEIIHYDPRQLDSLDELLTTESIDALVIINAHNPLGLITAPEKLLGWHAQLQKNNGWLIVDEAFIDPTPQHSVAAHTQLPGLIVLRSLGKFFGLAGVRCGYAFCAEEISRSLQIAIGPWAVSGPTLQIATAALSDGTWQNSMRSELQRMSAANAELLQKTHWASNHELLRNPLFHTAVLPTQNSLKVEDELARQGVRVRRIELNAEQSLLRFGLVDPEQREVWARYAQCLNDVRL